MAILDFGFGKVSRYMTNNAKAGATKQMIDLCTKDNYDILVMGSSKAHHNYIPNIIGNELGHSCYNAGRDGNGIILAYGILSMLSDDRLPKTIIYDLKQQFDVYHYSGDGDYTRYYQILKVFYGWQPVNDIIGSICKQDLVKYRSSLYRRNGELFSIINGFISKPTADPDLGYVPAIGELKDGSEQEKDYTDQIDDLKISYFKKFVKLCKTKEINLVIVFSPEYNTPVASDFEPVRDICYREGVTLLDYFEDASFQNMAYFKDHCHLNETGAKVFTQRIIDDISLL